MVEESAESATSSLSGGTMLTLTSRTAVAAIALGLVAGGTAPALASGGGGDVRRSGGCTHSSVWKLKAKPDNGRIEVEGEVDSNHGGQVWKWRIFHDGSVSAHGRSRTGPPSGSFSVERRLVNTSGSDRVGWRAVNPGSGERCHGTLSL
jgi:hypothetical protein